MCRKPFSQGKRNYATPRLASRRIRLLERQPADHADTATTIARYGRSLEKANALLRKFLENPQPEASASCRDSLKGAILTPDHALSVEAKALLDVLRA